MAINQPGMLASQGAGQAPVQPPQDPAMAQDPLAKQDTQGAEGEQPSQAEQDEYDQVVMAGMTIIFEKDDLREKLIELLKADKQHPAKALAEVITMLMIQLDKKAGGKITETVILPAATELLEQLAELVESLKLFPIDDAVVNRAAQLMLTKLGDYYGVTEEDLAEILASVPPEQARAMADQQGGYARKQPPVQQEVEEV